MSKILIVDDQFDIRRLLRAMLGKEFEILEASDGLGALECLQREWPTVILLDVMMPGELDGLQVLDAIKANPATSHIKVAMVTAKGQASDQLDALHRGADAYFIKPFSPLQVVKWVRNQCR